MGFFSNQLSNVVEWQETREDVMFWKWSNDEIKKAVVAKVLHRDIMRLFLDILMWIIIISVFRAMRKGI